MAVKHAVGVAQRVRFSFGIAPGEEFCADGFANERIACGGARYGGHVACRGILARGGKAAARLENRTFRSDLPRELRHFRPERRFAPRIVTRERAGRVVGAQHEHGLQQLPSGVSAADRMGQFGRAATGVRRGDGHGFVQIAGASDDHGGDEFLHAGHFAAQVGVVGEEHFARTVGDDHGIAAD